MKHWIDVDVLFIFFKTNLFYRDLTFYIYSMRFSRYILSDCWAVTTYKKNSSYIQSLLSDRSLYIHQPNGLLFLKGSGTHLLSHAVPSVVSSAVRGLTIVFGMGTGVSPGRIGTRNLYLDVHQFASSDSGTPFPHHAIRRMAFRIRSCFPECKHSSSSSVCSPLCSLVAWTFITEH